MAINWKKRHDALKAQLDEAIRIGEIRESFRESAVKHGEVVSAREVATSKLLDRAIQAMHAAAENMKAHGIASSARELDAVAFDISAKRTPR